MGFAPRGERCDLLRWLDYEDGVMEEVVYIFHFGVLVGEAEGFGAEVAGCDDDGVESCAVDG